MEASLCLRSGAALDQVQALLQRHRVQVAPMHPGVRDAALAAWYVLSAPDAKALAAAVAELQQHPAVDAAYVKPAGEAPG